MLSDEFKLRYRGICIRNGLIYYRWKRKGRDHYERMPAIDHPDFPAAYNAALEARRPKPPADALLAAKAVRRWNGVQQGRDRSDRAIPMWLIMLAREARKRASRRKMSFTLSRPDLSLLHRRAAGQCEVTGIAFTHDRHPGSVWRPFAPSIDRIESSGGYELRNVRLTCVIVNAALNQWGEEPFWRMVRAAAERDKGQTQDPNWGK